MRQIELPKLSGRRPSLMERALEQSLSVLEPENDLIIDSRHQCEKSLHHFIRQSWQVVEPETQFIDGWVVGCFAEHLQAMAELQIRNLLVSAPPRFIKSIAAAICLPAWRWSKKAGDKFIFSTYSQQFTRRDSNRTKRLIESDWYQARWGHRFTLVETGAERIVNDRAGHRLAAAVQGQGAGEGGDWLVGDDLLKPIEARSEAARSRAINFWTQTINFRGNNPLTVRKLLMMHRLHRQDPIGHLVASEADYDYLCLPMEHEPKRYFGTRAEAKASPVRDPIWPTRLQQARPELQDPRKEEGEPLWPERWDHAAIQALKQEPSTVSEGTAGQLQQRPADEKGEIFTSDDFRLCTTDRDKDGKLVFVMGSDQPGVPAPRVLVSRCRFYQIFDTAIQVNPKAKYTAGLTLAVVPMMGIDAKNTRHLVAYDAWRERLEVREQLPAIQELKIGRAEFDVAKRTWKLRGKDDPWPKPIMLQGVEAKASGPGLIQDARADGKPLEGIPAKGSKIDRAAQAVNLYRLGILWHWAGMRNRSEFEDELKDFPSGLYNDWTDCLGHGARKFFKDRLLAEFDGEALEATQAKRDVALRRNVVNVAGHEIRFDDED